MALRILYISHSHPPVNAPLENVGGMQRVSMQLEQALRRHRSVKLFSMVQQTSWSWIGVKTFHFLWNLLFRVPVVAERFKPDVIIFSSMVTALTATILKSRLDTPMIAVTHGKDVTLPFFLYQYFLPVIFSKLDGVISVSHATRQACMDRGLAEEKSIVIPNGFHDFPLTTFIERTTAKQSLEEIVHRPFLNKKILLTVGRLIERKGHAWFIENVFLKIRHDCVYLIIGEGPEYSAIENMIRRMNLQSCVQLLGKQTDEVLKMAYAAADIFVMPNVPVEGDMEGFGIVLLEANMAGTPVIASDLEGIKDVISQGKNGYRIPYGHPEIFAERIDVMLNGESKQMAATCRAYVESHFSWDSIVPRYINYLNEIVSDYIPETDRGLITAEPSESEVAVS
ncbi:glycosyltransferase family 4 protein [bacterium]|nr:glycosyltransferase family 4 protein [bacterium]